MIEEWRPIAETNGKYEVSNMGRIRFVKNGHIRKNKTLPNGYLYFSFAANKKRLYRYVHRLVADAFCDHPEGCNVINHLDNNKKNNRADNLEWVTQFDNVHFGMKQKRYRLNAVPVVGFKDGKRYEFVSAHNAATNTGCDYSGIIKCCKGKRNTVHGYKWKYAEVSA